MNAFVVDTNVPMVANGRSNQADPDCVIACILALTDIREEGVIMLDDALLILKEYMRNLSMSGQPGPGDFFMKWVWTIQAHPERCKLVTITPRADDPTNFIEFPNDADLADFDRSDRKFVAVALASGSAPEVVNAVDSDWANHFAALTRHGIRLKFLCPQYVSPTKHDLRVRRPGAGGAATQRAGTELAGDHAVGARHGRAASPARRVIRTG